MYEYFKLGIPSVATNFIQSIKHNIDIIITIGLYVQLWYMTAKIFDYWNIKIIILFVHVSDSYILKTDL